MNEVEDNPNHRLWKERQAKRAETEWMVGSKAPSRRRPTDEEVQEIRRLKAEEGKTPREARAAVLGQEVYTSVDEDGREIFGVRDA